jgi:hypothetical protein
MAPPKRRVNFPGPIFFPHARLALLAFAVCFAVGRAKPGFTGSRVDPVIALVVHHIVEFEQLFPDFIVARLDFCCAFGDRDG